MMKRFKMITQVQDVEVNFSFCMVHEVYSFLFDQLLVKDFKLT